ncbi:MAG: methylmalonyl-CoA mutase family protein, partial [Gemmatimonadales bacterium]
GVVCGGSSLTAAQPYNNVVRVAIEAMAAVAGGAQSIFTCAFDEAFQIPTEFSAELALRTQQIIAYESGIARTVDPLGGSYYVESLTDRMEEAIVAVMDEIERYGGAVRAIEDGWLQSRLAHRALERKRGIDTGATIVVGQNRFRRDDEGENIGEAFRLDPEAGRRIAGQYEAVRARRDAGAVARALDRLQAAAGRDDDNHVPDLIGCCHADASVGERVGRLRARWGDFREPVGL